MTKKIACFTLDDGGACTTEYGFIAALMSLIILTGLAQLAPKIAHVFQLANCIDVCILD